LQNDEEALMIIKTRAAVAAEVTKAVTKMHPYDCAEVIFLPVVDGFEGYLGWVKNEVVRGT